MTTENKPKIKQIRINPNISEHDLKIKQKAIEGFLEKGQRVKISIIFKGRTITRPESGLLLLKKLAIDTSHISRLEGLPSLKGRAMTMMLAPKTKEG